MITNIILYKYGSNVSSISCSSSSAVAAAAAAAATLGE